MDTQTAEKKVQALYSLMEKCRLCPRRCEVNRLKGQRGVCRTGKLPEVASYGPHFGEEEPLVGRGGSGTVFFAHCNLRCVFCQNYDISQLGRGVETDVDGLVEIMLELEERGCHNINFVTPSHVAAHVADAVMRARHRGLGVPVVYNTSAYDSVETLRLLEGLIDIYMPDFKYWKPETALRYSVAPDYPDVARRAVKEMHRQVGDLVLDSSGVAKRGLLVRHLVMPGLVEETKQILKFLREEISENTYVNIMAQYRPLYRAVNYREIARMITAGEYREAVEFARKIGLRRLDRENLVRLWR